MNIFKHGTILVDGIDYDLFYCFEERLDDDVFCRFHVNHNGSRITLYPSLCITAIGTDEEQYNDLSQILSLVKPGFASQISEKI